MKILILALAAASSLLLIGTLSFGFRLMDGRVTPESHMRLALAAVGTSILTHILSILYLLLKGKRNRNQVRMEG